MRGERDQSPDRAFAELARRQHGTVSRAQVRTVGLSDDQIDRLLRCGRLRPIHRGVYAVGPLSSLLLETAWPPRSLAESGPS